MPEPIIVKPSEHRLVLRFGRLAAVLNNPISGIVRRWREGDEFVFDSLNRTLTRNGTLVAPFQNISKVVFRIFRSDDERHDHFTASLELQDGAKVELAATTFTTREKFVDQLSQEVAAFLGKRVTIENASPQHGERIRSLDLTERQLDSEKE